MNVDTVKQETPGLDIMRLIEAVRGSQAARVLYETRFIRKDAFIAFDDRYNPAQALEATKPAPVNVGV